MFPLNEVAHGSCCTDPFVSDEELRKKARRRALRAAQVVTLGLAMAGPGCGHSYEVGVDGSAGDGGRTRSDAGTPPSPPGDLGSPMVDLGPMTADMGSCPAGSFDPPPETEECCNEIGGYWDGAAGECLVAVPGPFVPPSMTAEA